MKVLVVDDVPEVVTTIEVCFRIRWPNTTVISTKNGCEAVDLVESRAPDIVLLDLGLPDVDGMQVLREIRRFSDLPVIIVTGNDHESVKVMGLEMGADDYMVKPFSCSELMARAKAVLRRSHMPELRGDGGLINRQGISIDLTAHCMIVEGEEVSLTPTEWRLMTYLARNEGRVIPHRALAERVWGSEFLNGPAIKMCVRRLRLKLERRGKSPAIIRTHRGVGYSLSMSG